MKGLVPMDLSQHLKLYPLPWQDDHVRPQKMGALPINVWPHLDTVLIENRPRETPNSGPARVCSGSLSVRAMRLLSLPRDALGHAGIGVGLEAGSIEPTPNTP